MNASEEKNMLKNVNGYLLSAAEAAKRLGVSSPTLRRWNLPQIRLGKKVYYEESIIEKLLEGK
ncbi:MAG: helix-turn-helix domain-containing protein [Lentisphaeria bacterium]|nr:MAG: helix-turn-helix domain-containing protein [Lentisphaeria bacterium]